VTDQTETKLNTEPAEGATPAVGGDDLEARIASAVASQLDKAVEARLASITSANNKEFARLRKRIEGRGETPRPETEDGEGQAPKTSAVTGLTREDLKAHSEIVRLRASLPEDIANDVDADEDAPFAERVAALRVAAKVHAKAKAAEPEAEKKPGRDVRSNGSARGQAPAVRSADGYPATFEEWDALTIEKKRALRERHPDKIPRLLPRTTRA
jgi:hypothetical protein